jgi:phage terminase large subunit-like protein
MVTFVTVVVVDRDRPDLAVLLGDEEMVLVVRSEGRSYRRAESAGHGVEADGHVAPLDQGWDRIRYPWSQRDGW